LSRIYPRITTKTTRISNTEKQNDMSVANFFIKVFVILIRILSLTSRSETIAFDFSNCEKFRSVPITSWKKTQFRLEQNLPTYYCT